MVLPRLFEPAALRSLQCTPDPISDASPYSATVQLVEHAVSVRDLALALREPQRVSHATRVQQEPGLAPLRVVREPVCAPLPRRLRMPHFKVPVANALRRRSDGSADGSNHAAFADYARSDASSHASTRSVSIPAGVGTLPHVLENEERV